jgi:transketolase
MRLLPKFEVFQPGSEKELDFLLRHYYNSLNTSYFRMSDHPHPLDLKLEKERGVVVKDMGSEVTVVTAGPIMDYVMKATDGLHVNILYFHTLKPFDHELIRKFSGSRIKVVHDSFGLWESVCESAGRSVEKLGLPDHFCCSYGTIHDVRKYAGLDVESIRNFITS